MTTPESHGADERRISARTSTRSGYSEAAFFRSLSPGLKAGYAAVTVIGWLLIALMVVAVAIGLFFAITDPDPADYRPSNNYGREQCWDNLGGSGDC